jgi:lysophospholipase L1-like esterase
MITVRRLFFLSLSLALLAPLAPAPARQKPAGAPVAPAAPAARKGEALLERVAVIGASVSAGFGLGADTQKLPLNLKRVIDAGLIAKHAALVDASSEMTFLDALGTSKSAFKALEKDDPTLVVALDYLFWFGYGETWGGEKERLAALELGLKSLEGLACPILLGDFPDMRTALQVKNPIIQAKAVPDPATLAKLNERLGVWAKEHKNVIVVPVSKLMGALLAGDELRVGPNVWRKGTVSALLQDDGLHPTLEGTTGMWLFAAECLLEAHKDLPRGALEPKAGTIATKLAPEQRLGVVYEPIQDKRGKTAPAKSVH